MPLRDRAAIGGWLERLAVGAHRSGLDRGEGGDWVVWIDGDSRRNGRDRFRFRPGFDTGDRRSLVHGPF